ncbi:hypothetical protein [Luteimonas aquatica]|uniref:hypothetical protein n=1 Tax=Luteimonas aquatica TaxID=450364 RepID=UPI001F5778D5|nr:hypothetical protein [Luteimonas aquatica]
MTTDGILVLLFLAIFVPVAVLLRRKELRDLQGSFDAVTFSEAENLHGRDLRVVKRVTEAALAQEGGGGILGAHWYCVGPGPSYYVAIAQTVPSSGWRARLAWTVRPLSAERMRGALIGDREALVAAFGEEGAGSPG